MWSRVLVLSMLLLMIPMPVFAQGSPKLEVYHKDETLEFNGLTGEDDAFLSYIELTAQGGDMSMSRKLWVRFFQRLEGVHREVTFQHPLLGAPQGYLRGQRARTHLVGEHPYYPRPPLHLPKEPLQHVRRASPGVVAPRKAQVA